VHQQPTVAAVFLLEYIINKPIIKLFLESGGPTASATT